MKIPRRGALAALPVLLAARAAQADTTDLAVSCDTAAAPAVRRAAAAFRQRSGVRVRIFPTMPSLLLPQLERDIQNDIIFTRTQVIDQAEKQGLVKPGGRAGPWRNPLVTATAAAPAGPEGSFAVPDASPATDFDGRAVLAATGVSPAKVLGVLDTGAVAWMLANGQARQGLVFRTDVAADDRLRAGAPVPDAAWPPVLYAATVTTLAYRGNPAAFVAFLGSADGLAELQAAGLEKVA
jgi:hypothetical protein